MAYSGGGIRGREDRGPRTVGSDSELSLHGQLGGGGGGVGRRVGVHLGHKCINTLEGGSEKVLYVGRVIPTIPVTCVVIIKLKDWACSTNLKYLTTYCKTCYG